MTKHIIWAAVVVVIALLTLGVFAQKDQYQMHHDGSVSLYNVIRLNTRTGEMVRCTENVNRSYPVAGYSDGCKTILSD